MKGDGGRNRRRLIVGGWLGPFFRIIDSRRVALDYCLLLSRVIYFVAIVAFIGEGMSSRFLSTGNLVLIITCVGNG